MRTTSNKSSKRKSRYGPKVRSGSFDSKIDEIHDQLETQEEAAACQSATLVNSLIAVESSSATDSSHELQAAILALEQCRLALSTEKDSVVVLQERLKVFEQEIEQLRRENTEFSMQASIFRKSQAMSTDSVASEDRNRILFLEKENGKIKFALDAALKQAEAANNSIVQAEAKNESELERVKAELEASKEKSKELQAQLSKNEEEYACRLRELTEENVRLALDLDDARKQKDEFQAEVDELKKESLAASGPDNENASPDAEFQRAYLSNLIVRFLENPKQRSVLVKPLVLALNMPPEQAKRLKP
jgi:chromosome segregation ATPase